MRTITLQFADSDDLKHFQKYVGFAKESNGTVTGLYCGLMCAALKRSRTISDHSPELLEACKFILSQLDPNNDHPKTQCVLNSDCLSPKDTDDQSVVEYLKEVIHKAEGNV